jgi:glycosyltransferase involved in cell wall biosynthesis
MLQRAALILCGTAAGKTEIEQFYQVPGERIKILPFPTPQFVLDAPCSDGRPLLEKYHLPENYLFYPAQFWPHKNHVGLLLAVKLLRDQYHLTFPVVFSGSDRGNQSYIRQVVQRLDLEEQVHFLGFIPQTDLIALYRNAFALTYMSFFGPDNLPPLEAMGLGCPVIASRVAGAEEQLGDAAWLFDLQSAEQEVALAIKSLHEDPSLRQSLIDRGLKRACASTPKDYAKGILAILDEIDVIRRCWE